MKFSICFILFSFSFSLHAQTWVWAKGADPASLAEGYNVATDASGNVFVTGYFQSATITFGAFTLSNSNSGSGDAYLVKYDPSGNVLWAKSIGGIDFDLGNNVTTDISGNVYVTGNFQSASITLGAYTLTNTLHGDYDIFIAKYDAAGNVVWAKSAGGAQTDNGYGIATDNLGNIYLTGSFTSSTITFGSVTLNNTANGNYWQIFLAKYDPSGNVLWATTEGGINNEEAYDVATDVSGNVFITGYFTTPVFTFGSVTLTNADNSGNSPDLFLAKFDPSGTVLWVKNAGGTTNDYGYGVAADISGNIYLTGGFTSSSITFGSTTLANTAVGSYDFFLVKYDAGGNMLWTKNAVGTGSDEGYSVGTDAAKNIYVAGSFTSSSITFDAFTLQYPVGGTDPMFIVKYDSTGNVLCGSALMSGGDDQNSVAVDAFGNAYVGGDYQPVNFIVGTDTLNLSTSSSTDETVFVAKYTCDSLTVNPPSPTSECSTIYVPNAFSPNDDGQNDVLFVRSPCIEKLFFAVYDRWGEKVFETTDITKGWDGTFRGEKMSNAVFTYYVTATFTNGTSGFAKGNVSLIK